ncbi:MAG: efflux RND transporter periplasmic adaptor subunit [Fimbriimonas sp.]
MRAKLIWGVVALAVVAGAAFFFTRDQKAEPEIEFRYAAVETGTLRRSISATGQLVALTTVDVKSKAGGKVVQLAVDEGAVVKAGQLIARIDPADTMAVYEQAQADLTSANARATQAEQNLSLQKASAETAVQSAQSNLETARIRLQRAELQAARQPKVTKTTYATAKANYDAAVSSLDRVQNVEIPQRQRDVNGGLSQARVALKTAQDDLERQQGLFAKGYVAGSVVDRARSAAEAAKVAFETAQQKQSTLAREVEVTLRAETLAVARAKAALDQAEANRVDDDLSVNSLEEARKTVRSAEIELAKARDNRMQVQMRAAEMVAAKSSTVRSRVSVDNAKVQLDSTTVLAPRDGVVTLKYLEEGTIIPPGTSTFAQGTSIVQISDVTQLFVECAVDESDVAAVKPGQDVRITTEAFPRDSLPGIVVRVNPAATTLQNVTAVKVRVRIKPGYKVKILPGMNATCEFVTLELPNVVVAPAQAVKFDADGKATVRVKTSDPKKAEVRTVEVGETGNDGIEIKSGLKAGDQVVVAEVNLVELRETQKKMIEATQGGGLMGGPPGGGRATGGGNRGGGGGGAGGAGGGRPGGAR